MNVKLILQPTEPVRESHKLTRKSMEWPAHYNDEHFSLLQNSSKRFKQSTTLASSNS